MLNSPSKLQGPFDQKGLGAGGIVIGDSKDHPTDILAILYQTWCKRTVPKVSKIQATIVKTYHLTGMILLSSLTKLIKSMIQPSKMKIKPWGIKASIEVFLKNSGPH